jgi:hypothetical protein
MRSNEICLVLFSLFTIARCISVIASVRGTKFYVKSDSVFNLISELKQQNPSLKSGDYSVLFKGKVLKYNDILSEIGVNEGDVLTVLKGRKLSMPPKSVSLKPSKSKLKFDRWSNLLKEEHSDILQDVAENFDLNQALKSVESMVDSNLLDEYFTDDSKLELARLQLLENLDKYEEMIPGFKDQTQDIVMDALKWKQAMTSAKDQIKSLRKAHEIQKD